MKRVTVSQMPCSLYYNVELWVLISDPLGDQWKRLRHLMIHENKLGSTITELCQ